MNRMNSILNNAMAIHSPEGGAPVNIEDNVRAGKVANRKVRIPWRVVSGGNIFPVRHARLAVEAIARNAHHHNLTLKEESRILRNRLRAYRQNRKAARRAIRLAHFHGA